MRERVPDANPPALSTVYASQEFRETLAQIILRLQDDSGDHAEDVSKVSSQGVVCKPTSSWRFEEGVSTADHSLADDCSEAASPPCEFPSMLAHIRSLETRLRVEGAEFTKGDAPVEPPFSRGPKRDHEAAVQLLAKAAEVEVVHVGCQAEAAKSSEQTVQSTWSSLAAMLPPGLDRRLLEATRELESSTEESHCQTAERLHRAWQTHVQLESEPAGRESVSLVAWGVVMAAALDAMLLLWQQCRHARSERKPESVETEHSASKVAALQGESRGGGPASQQGSDDLVEVGSCSSSGEASRLHIVHDALQASCPESSLTLTVGEVQRSSSIHRERLREETKTLRLKLRLQKLRSRANTMDASGSEGPAPEVSKMEGLDVASHAATDRTSSNMPLVECSLEGHSLQQASCPTREVQPERRASPFRSAVSSRSPRPRAQSASPVRRITSSPAVRRSLGNHAATPRRMPGQPVRPLYRVDPPEAEVTERSRSCGQFPPGLVAHLNSSLSLQAAAQRWAPGACISSELGLKSMLGGCKAFVPGNQAQVCPSKSAGRMMPMRRPCSPVRAFHGQHVVLAGV